MHQTRSFLCAFRLYLYARFFLSGVPHERCMCYARRVVLLHVTLCILGLALCVFTLMSYLRVATEWSAGWRDNSWMVLWVCHSGHLDFDIGFEIILFPVLPAHLFISSCLEVCKMEFTSSLKKNRIESRWGLISLWFARFWWSYESFTTIRAQYGILTDIQNSRALPCCLIYDGLQYLSHIIDTPILLNV